MRKLWILATCGLVMSSLGAACEPYNPQSPSKEARTMENCSIAVAKIIGVPWTPETGATEKLTEFNHRVKECMRG